MPRKKPVTAEELLAEMRTWPTIWGLCKESRALGKGLVSEFKPFVIHLTSSKLSPSTVMRHFHNLWLLGHLIVRRADLFREDLARPPGEVLEEAIIGGEGPLIDAGEDADQTAQNEFERTTRKLAKFRGLEVW